MARIIILNGTSSAGKTTLASALREVLPGSFCYFASDQLADAGFRPRSKSPDERARFFAGFHRSIAGFAAAGNDLIVEHIVETSQWAEDLEQLLGPSDVFWVGIKVPLEVAEARERDRGDRQIGEAAFHQKTYGFCRYDLEMDGTGDPEVNARLLADAWNARGVVKPSS